MSENPSSKKVENRERSSGSPRSDHRISARQRRMVRNQRVAVLVGIVLILAILAFPAYGFYDTFIRPPRVWASHVGETTNTMGDLVKRIRTQQGMLRETGQYVDLSRSPFVSLEEMTQNQLIIAASPELGITVTEKEVDSAILNNFFPNLKQAEEVSPDQLDSEFKESYIQFLDQSRLDEKEFRQVTREDLYRSKLTALLASQMPTEEESVEVNWLAFPADRDTVPSDFEKYQDQVRREGFSATFNSLGKPNDNGYIGWIPRGAITDLDHIFFGDAKNDIEPLELNKVSEVLFSQKLNPNSDGVFLIIQVVNREMHAISDQMHHMLLRTTIERWLSNKWLEAVEQDNLEINFNSDLYAWVAKQVKQSRARFTPSPN